MLDVNYEKENYVNELLAINRGLLETIELQTETISQLNYDTVAGLRFSDDIIDHMQTIFPGGVLSTPDEAYGPIVSRAIRDMSIMTHLRQETAMLGAMRWPWSQEAAISNKKGYFDYV